MTYMVDWANYQSSGSTSVRKLVSFIILIYYTLHDKTRHNLSQIASLLNIAHGDV